MTLFSFSTDFLFFSVSTIETVSREEKHLRYSWFSNHNVKESTEKLLNFMFLNFTINRINPSAHFHNFDILGYHRYGTGSNTDWITSLIVVQLRIILSLETTNEIQ